MVCNAFCFYAVYSNVCFAASSGSDLSHPQGEGTVERDRFPDPLLDHIMAQGDTVRVQLGVQAGAEARAQGEMVEA